jgi:hypothetical protein
MAENYRGICFIKLAPEVHLVEEHLSGVPAVISNFGVRPVNDKHSSLFVSGASVTKETSFTSLAPGVNVIKLFSFIAEDEGK